MGAGGDEFGDGMGEGGERIYVEDGERVFAIVDAAFGKDDGNEVDAGGAEEGKRGRFREELL
jgi:hypothetical protein